ncbi:MAG TPA: hypothetical protein VFV50_03750, partial [Bdellovibrionales bacterium]|nr:hypothetical protein [Bdellovibrionales bacterium]
SLLMHDPGQLENTDLAAQALMRDPIAGPNIVTYESPLRVLTWLRERAAPAGYDVEADFKMSLSYKQLVDPDGIPRAQLYLRDISVADLQTLKARAEKICENWGCHVAGDLMAYSDFATKIPKTLLDSMSTSIFMVAGVVGFVALALGRTRHLAALLLSSFWGPCLMVIMMAALKIPMDFLKCIFASTLVGLAGDNAIQYLYASRTDDLHDGIEHHGGASIQTATLMALTCLLYLGSYFDPPKTFGLIMAAGLMAGLAGDLFLLNGLLRRREPLQAREESKALAVGEAR